MDSLSYKTISANAATVDKQWVVIDATDEVLGRLASQVAKILRGKNKPSYTPHVDCGDYVIVINADKVKLTGNEDDRQRSTHDTPVSREVSVSLRRPITWRRNRRFSSRRLSKACSPKRDLGEAIMKNLKVYAGAEHPHAAQNPKAIKLNEIK